MTSKREIIFTADDFGLKKTYNDAILDCFLNGFLTSACVCANGDAYNDAMERVLPQCIKSGKKLDLGVHLNVIEGKSLREHTYLTDKNGNFRHGFLSLLLNSYNQDFMWELEEEFRAQIEAILRDSEAKGFEVSFINSHVHVHAIPKIFQLVKKLALEYKIPFIRTQNEMLYVTDKASPRIINIIKVFILKFFTLLFNKTDITNKYITGVGFTGEMGKEEIFYGIKHLLKHKEGLVEILIHPDSDENNSERYQQFLSAKNLGLKKKIEDLGFSFTTISEFNQGN